MSTVGTTATRVIDCDTHYWESVDVWERHIDPAFRDRAPALVHDDAGRLLMRVGESIYPSAPQHPGLARTDRKSVV